MPVLILKGVYMIIIFGDNKVVIDAGTRHDNVGVCKLIKVFNALTDISEYSEKNRCDAPCYLEFKTVESLQKLIDSLEYVKGLMIEGVQK